MRIILTTPNSPYKSELDPGVMNVTLKDVFNGVGLEASSGEKLGVCMRDTGFEVHYYGDFGDHGFDAGWVEFKNGLVLPSKRSI